MKFKRYAITKEKREWTPAKLSAAKRAVKREQSKTPLFPDMSKYKDVSERVADVDRNHDRFVITFRTHQAQTWRKARALYYQLPAISRAGLKLYWESWGGPLDPNYMLGMLRRIKKGQSAWTWLREYRQIQLAGVGGLNK